MVVFAFFTAMLSVALHYSSRGFAVSISYDDDDAMLYQQRPGLQADVYIIPRKFSVRVKFWNGRLSGICADGSETGNKCEYGVKLRVCARYTAVKDKKPEDCTQCEDKSIILLRNADATPQVNVDFASGSCQSAETMPRIFQLYGRCPHAIHQFPSVLNITRSLLNGWFSIQVTGFAKIVYKPSLAYVATNQHLLRLPTYADLVARNAHDDFEQRKAFAVNMSCVQTVCEHFWVSFDAFVHLKPGVGQPHYIHRRNY